MRELTGSERKYLRGLAHGLKPIVQVGREGVSPAVVASADAALRAHELVKVRFVGHTDERRELAERLAAELNEPADRVLDLPFTL